MRVLLVEDEKGISSAICQVLKKENFSVDPVFTGTDGLDYALTENYDAVVLDVMLPEMDGFQVLKRIVHTDNIDLNIGIELQNTGNHPIP